MHADLAAAAGWVCAIHLAGHAELAAAGRDFRERVARLAANSRDPGIHRFCSIAAASGLRQGSGDRAG
jgi:hypothetical protein